MTWGVLQFFVHYELLKHTGEYWHLQHQNNWWSKPLDKFGSKTFTNAGMLLLSSSNFAQFMSLRSPKSFALKYLVWEMSNIMKYILCTFENITWKILTHTINPYPNRAHFNTLLYGFSHSSCVWDSCYRTWLVQALTRSLKKAVSQAAHPRTTIYMEKRHLKHETSVMKSPCRGLPLESEKQEGAVSTDCNLFSQFLLWERQVLQGWFSWLWISCRFLHTRFRAVLICKCTLASRSLDEDITKSNHGIAARFSVPRL